MELQVHLYSDTSAYNVLCIILFTTQCASDSPNPDSVKHVIYLHTGIKQGRPIAG